VSPALAPASQAGGIAGSAATAAAEAQTPSPPTPSLFESADLAHILGLQGNIWTEHIRTEERVEAMAFPRAAAVAEAGWSMQSNRDWDDFLARLPAEFDRFARVGLKEDESVFSVEMKVAGAEDGGVQVAMSNPPQPNHSRLATDPPEPPLVGPGPAAAAVTPGGDPSRPVIAPSATAALPEAESEPGRTLLGEIRYSTTAGQARGPSRAYAAPILVPVPTRLTAATFVDGRKISPTLERRLDALSVRRRVSQELALCTEKLPLNLEGDPQPGGARPVFLVDIMNPCWIWTAAQLSDIGAVSVGVGRLPFNFQIGADLKKIVLRPAATPEGELQVRLDSCLGALVATLPLAPASAAPGIGALTTSLPPIEGTHALCFEFTARRVDPLWAIAWVQLVPRARPGGVAP
jgi:hexosaminidase